MGSSLKCECTTHPRRAQAEKPFCADQGTTREVALTTAAEQAANAAMATVTFEETPPDNNNRGGGSAAGFGQRAYCGRGHGSWLCTSRPLTSMICWTQAPTLIFTDFSHTIIYPPLEKNKSSDLCIQGILWKPTSCCQTCVTIYPSSKYNSCH